MWVWLTLLISPSNLPSERVVLPRSESATTLRYRPLRNTTMSGMWLQPLASAPLNGSANWQSRSAKTHLWLLRQGVQHITFIWLLQISTSKLVKTKKSLNQHSEVVLTLVFDNKWWRERPRLSVNLFDFPRIVCCKFVLLSLELCLWKVVSGLIC